MKRMGVHLHKAEAQNLKGNATIRVTLEIESLEEVQRLQNRFEKIKNVGQVFCFPVSVAQRLAFGVEPVQTKANPYTEQEVYITLPFYDREDPISYIRDWVRQPLPVNWLVLHGQGRVGKTSLIRHVMHEFLDRAQPAYPVFADLQALSDSGAQNLANFLVRQVYEALQQEVPPQQKWEEPIPWLNRSLADAVRLLGERRLLLMIDEFNVLLDREHRKMLDPSVFANLRAVMNDRRDLNWLLVVQDSHFSDPKRWGSAGPLFQQAAFLPLHNLDQRWARKLITEPARRVGISFDGSNKDLDLPANIFDLTAGNPYLIHVLCRNLVERMRGRNQTTVTAEDLEAVVSLVLSDGRRYFDHLLRNIADDFNSLAVLSTIASASREHWIDLPTVSKRLDDNGMPLAIEILDSTVDNLARLGILQVARDDSGLNASILVALFHRWLSEYLLPEQVRDEFKPTRGSG